MNILPYKPTKSVKWLEEFFAKNYYKKPYDRFMWWRSYVPKNRPLHNKNYLRDKIVNGDFDIAPFIYEVELVEHRLNQKHKEIFPDTSKYLEVTSMDRARRKRLIEDAEKDEANKLSTLTKEFMKYYKLTKKQVEEEMLNSDGTLLEFFDYMHDKYDPLKQRSN